MSDKKIKTPEKIINATIECIERHGLNALTIRMIAEAADVNIAAVNYHFHSRENLVQKVKEISFIHMIDDLREMSLMQKRDPREIIREMCTYVIEGGAKFPEITRLAFYDAFIYNRTDGEMNRIFSEFLSEFAENITNKHHITRKDLNIALHRLFATLFFVSIFPDYFEGFTGYNLKNDKESRKGFIENLVNSLPF